MSNDLYTGAAWYYARFRPFYPEQEIDEIVDFFSLSATSRFLDMGSGTGQLAIQLAERVGGIVAVEPDDEMFVEGKSHAERKGATNIRWIKSKAEEVVSMPDLGLFDLVSFATSFHWMDRDAILQTLDRMVKPTGGILVTGTSSLWEGTEEWELVAKKTIQKYLGKERRAGSATFEQLSQKNDPHPDALRRSPFSAVEETRYHFVERERTLEEVVGLVYSMSFASPALFGERKEEFESELRHALLVLSPSGVFLKKERFYALFAKRASC